MSDHMPLSPNERGDDRPYYPGPKVQCAGCLEYFTDLALDDWCTCDHNALCAECAKGYTQGDDGLWHPVDTRALRAEVERLRAALTPFAAAVVFVRQGLSETPEAYVTPQQWRNAYAALEATHD